MTYQQNFECVLIGDFYYKNETYFHFFYIWKQVLIFFSIKKDFKINSVVRNLFQKYSLE